MQASTVLDIEIKLFIYLEIIFKIYFYELLM